VASVNDITPERARAALAEVDSRAASVDRSGSQYRFILLAIAAANVGLGVVVGFNPRGGSPFADVALLLLFGGAITVAVAVFWRVRAYSKAGRLRFAISCMAFTFWNAAVVGVSTASGWWGPQQPGSHFAASAAVASIPLLVAAWLLAPKRV
jgi:hypothetical protein